MGTRKGGGVSSYSEQSVWLGWKHLKYISRKNLCFLLLGDKMQGANILNEQAFCVMPSG